MPERSLKYGFEKDGNGRGLGRLFLVAPGRIWERAEKDEAFKALIEKLGVKSLKGIALERSNDATQVLINDRRIGPSPRKNEALLMTIGIIGVLEKEARICSAQDTAIKADLPLYPISSAQGYMPIIDIALPVETDFGIVEQLASDRMRTMAENLRHGPHIQAYSMVSRESGVIVGIDNGNEKAFVGTQRKLFNPESPRAVLSGNIDNHEQQLICLAGAVAIAHADELV